MIPNNLKNIFPSYFVYLSFWIIFPLSSDKFGFFFLLTSSLFLYNELFHVTLILFIPICLQLYFKNIFLNKDTEKTP